MEFYFRKLNNDILFFFRNNENCKNKKNYDTWKKECNNILNFDSKSTFQKLIKSLNLRETSKIDEKSIVLKILTGIKYKLSILEILNKSETYIITEINTSKIIYEVTFYKEEKKC
jgi:hypothetical protein